MKKIVLSLLFIISFFISFGQPVSQRASANVTVQDARWMGQYNAFLPRFLDTSSANVQKGIDSCGALIYCYSTNALWFRDCLNGAKHWVQVLPSGGTSGSSGWIVGGNSSPMLVDGSNNAKFGTIDNIGIYMATNNTTRLLLDKGGIGTTSATTIGLGYDPSDGNKIKQFSAASSAWSLTGNAGTTVGTNFIGTTDNKGLMFKVNNAQAGYLDLVHNNTSFGSSSLFGNTSGAMNVAIGQSALVANETGSDNVAVGLESLQANTGGNRNVAIGKAAGNSNGLDANTYVGAFSAFDNSGNGNVAIGDSAMAGVTNGNYNTFVGYGLNGYSSGLNGYLALASNQSEKIGVNSAGAIQFSIGGFGTANYLLQSAGSGAPPTWVNPSSIVSGNTLQQVTHAGNTTDTTIIINGTTSRSAILEIHNSFANGEDLYTHSNTDFRAPYINLYKSRGTQASPTAVQLSCYECASLGGVNFGGYDGTTYYASASILTGPDENWTASNHGGHIAIYGSNNGGSLPQEIAQFGGLQPSLTGTTNNIIFFRPLTFGGNNTGVAGIFPNPASSPLTTLAFRDGSNVNDAKITAGRGVFSDTLFNAGNLYRNTAACVMTVFDTLLNAYFHQAIPTVSLSGTNNTITKFTSSSTVGNSGITDNGTTISTAENMSFGASNYLTFGSGGTGAGIKKASSQTLQVVQDDGSSAGDIHFRNFEGSGSYGSIANNVILYGNIGNGILRLADYAAGNTFTRLIFGNNDASHTSLKSNATQLQVRLADDSGDGNLSTGGFTATGLLSITAGANKSVGTATLVGGTVTVSNTRVTASSIIFLTDATTGSLVNIGTPTVGTIVAGTSFVINSSNVLDTSNINWLIIN